MCLAVVGNRCPKLESGHTCSYVQTGATIPNIIKPKTLGDVASVLAVVCKRMQHFPIIMLEPALHCGKDTTHKTLETTCNERVLPLSSWKGCANGSVRDFKIQRRERQRERQKKKTIGSISKTVTLHVHHAFFVHFFARYCTTTTRKCLISRFMEDILDIQLGYGP